MAPSIARSTYRKYASRAIFRRRLAAGPFSSCWLHRPTHCGPGGVRKPLSWRPNFLTAPDGFVRLCALRCPGNGGARQPEQSVLDEMEILTSGTGELRSLEPVRSARVELVDSAPLSARPMPRIETDPDPPPAGRLAKR